MPDFILRTGDKLQITATPPLVIPSPIIQDLIGTGIKVMIDRKTACVMGDELPPPLKAMAFPYTQPPFTIPGTLSVLKITLLPNHTTKVATYGGTKPFLLKGGQFLVDFGPALVPNPAKMPPPAATLDAQWPKKGTGVFITANLKVKAS